MPDTKAPPHPTEPVLRAFKFYLDTTDAQAEELARHAGANRWGYNYAVAIKQSAHKAWRARFEERIAAGRSEAEAKADIKAADRDLSARVKELDEHRKSLATAKKVLKKELDGRHARWMAAKKNLKAKGAPKDAIERVTAELDQVYAPLQQIAAEQEQVRASLLELKQQQFASGVSIPSAADIAAIWRTERDRPREEGGSPWWSEVNVYCFTGGFSNADSAWKNWLDSLSGRRAGRRSGYPRFKKKGRARDSFSLFHDVNKPSIRVPGPDYRHVHLSSLGRFRTHDSTKRLRRLVERGQAVIKSVTVSRSGSRWYASILTEVQQVLPVDPETGEPRPTRRQRVNGMVGVDLGSRNLAVLSQRLVQSDPDSQVIQASKPLNASLRRLKRAQQALSRTDRQGSARRRKAAARVARIHHQVALQRAGYLHQVTKRITGNFSHVVVENFDLIAMTASAAGTVQKPGRNVKVRSLFNRHMLDAALGEFRRQVDYKAPWYGSQMVLLDRAEATTATCSTCGTRNPSVSPSSSKFHCESCGLVLDRHENSARNIVRAGRRKLQEAAQDNGEAQNARGAPVSPPARKGRRREALNREDPPP
jgi:putative transposase